METCLKIHALRTSNLDLQRYSIEHTPIESVCGVSLLYINNGINYICRNDLLIYKIKELELTFIEVKNYNDKNIIAGLFIDTHL